MSKPKPKQKRPTGKGKTRQAFKRAEAELHRAEQDRAMAYEVAARADAAYEAAQARYDNMKPAMEDAAYAGS